MKYLFFLLLTSVVTFFLFLAMAYITRTPKIKESAEIENVIDILNIDSKTKERIVNNSKTTNQKSRPHYLNRTNNLKPQSLSITKYDQELKLKKHELNTISPVPSSIAFKEIIPSSQLQSIISKPLYPYEAYSNNIDGWVLLKLFITKTGSVENVELLDSEPRGVFENIAIKTAYKKVFPIKKDNIDPKKHTRNLKIQYNADEQHF